LLSIHPEQVILKATSTQPIKKTKAELIQFSLLNLKFLTQFQHVAQLE